LSTGDYRGIYPSPEASDKLNAVVYLVGG